MKRIHKRCLLGVLLLALLLCIFYIIKEPLPIEVRTENSDIEVLVESRILVHDDDKLF